MPHLLQSVIRIHSISTFLPKAHHPPYLAYLSSAMRFKASVHQRLPALFPLVNSPQAASTPLLSSR
jgi:hypothetical protein